MTAVRQSVPTRLRPFLGSAAMTPRERLEQRLEAIAHHESEVRAFAALNTEGARAAADRATDRRNAGRPISPIDGMVIGIKDIIETVDMPTGMGSPFYEGWQSGRDAASVAALREAGAVIIGKTVTTEFAATHPGKTCNPWDLARTPGGSSSGSAAAVAAGFVDAALGTQVIGSIIRPGSFCGCVGFKPTVGALNRGGSHDGLSQSCTGVLAASLEDAWQVAYEIAARAGGDPGFAGLAGPDSAPAGKKPSRVVFLETAGWPSAEAKAKAAIERALDRLSTLGVVVSACAGHPDIEAAEAAIAQALPVSSAINAWESRWPLNTYRNRDAAKLSGEMLDRLARAEGMSLADYRALLDLRNTTRDVYARLAANGDLCVTLSASGPAPEGLASTGRPDFAVSASLLGVPALSLPLFEVDGLPLGLQLVGFAGEDAALFAAAAWIRRELSC